MEWAVEVDSAVSDVIRIDGSLDQGGTHAPHGRGSRRFVAARCRYQHEKNDTGGVGHEMEGGGSVSITFGGKSFGP